MKITIELTEEKYFRMRSLLRDYFHDKDPKVNLNTTGEGLIIMAMEELSKKQARRSLQEYVMGEAEKEHPEPNGIMFIDKSYGECMLCQDKKSDYDGWFLRRHIDGQWVTMKKANEDEVKFFKNLISDKRP
jgi:hypothetical protein